MELLLLLFQNVAVVSSDLLLDTTTESWSYRANNTYQILIFYLRTRMCHSTTTIFIRVHDDIHCVIDKKGLAFLLLTDFSKAFDRVAHAKLIHKLSSQFMFSRSAIRLVQAFLTGRSQVVHVYGELSDNIGIISGVPQGSILGPLLFTMFVRRIPARVQNFLGWCARRQSRLPRTPDS